MDIGTAVIVAGVVNIFGMMLFMYSRDLQWFKKESWKIQKSNIMAENKIKLKKMEKELGISTGKTAVENKGLLDTLQNLDLDKIRGLLDLVQKDEDIDGSDNNPISMITDFARDNPEMVQSFLSGLNKNKTAKNEDFIFSN